MGYNYDWNNKVYDEKDRSQFPECLSQLIKWLAKILGFELFQPEAAILNFYPLKTTLAAHTDHSELCDSPLFSISFGQSAIFLIGGTNKEETPLPILLESGDILIMTGESRQFMHAVPRVFKSEKKEPWNTDLSNIFGEELEQSFLNECLNNEKWQKFNDYIQDIRINVNVRQFKN